MIRRVLFPVTTSLVLLWVVIPGLFTITDPASAPPLTIRATAGFALGWFIGLISFTAAFSFRIGWGIRRWRLFRWSFYFFLISIFVPLMFSNTIRQPMITLSVPTETALLWLTIAVPGTIITLIFSGKRVRLQRAIDQQQQALLTIVRDSISEGMALVDESMHVVWMNESGQRHLMQKNDLNPAVARLVQRARETRSTVGQSMSVDESLRINVQASPVQHGLYSLIARPLNNEADPHGFYERFIRRIVHDMRNPLAAIIAHASNLSTAAPDPILARTASTIENEAQRLTRLVDSLLFDARLVYVPLMLEKIDLLDIVEEVFYQHDERATREGKTIEIELTPASAIIQGDRDLLVRAVSNLVDNSLKYSSLAAIIRITLESTDTHHYLRVIDTGDGIPPEYLPDQIFEALVRVRPRDGVSGSGLGLSIVRKIAEMHNGSVAAESQLGKGTTITLCLPR